MKVDCSVFLGDRNTGECYTGTLDFETAQIEIPDFVRNLRTKRRLVEFKFDGQFLIFDLKLKKGILSVVSEKFETLRKSTLLQNKLNTSLQHKEGVSKIKL